MAKQRLTKNETAILIEEVANRIEQGDRSFDLHLPLIKAQKGLAELYHLEGVQLLNRIGLLLTHDEGETFFYPMVKETIEALSPLDPAKDCEALRTLAKEIRNER